MPPTPSPDQIDIYLRLRRCGIRTAGEGVAL